MIPYLILIFVPLLFSFVAFTTKLKDYSGKRTLAIGVDKNIRNNSLLIPMFFIIFFILLALRDESIGSDIENYKAHFEAVSQMGLKYVFLRGGDFLYYVLSWIVSLFTSDFRILLMVVAGIILFPIAKFYSEDRELGFLKIIMFMNFPIFVMIFSGLRQAIAFSIGLIAYKYVREKKFLRFLILVLIAIGFHHSAFIILFYYPLYYANFKVKHLWFLVPSVVVVFIFNNPIFMWLTGILSLIFGEDYNVEINEIDAYAMLILFILLAVFSFVIPDESKMDKETFGLRNLLLMAVLLQCFSPLYSLAMRMNYYYILFIPVLIPKIIKCRKTYFDNVGYIAGGVLSAYFLIYYVIKLYNSCVTGISSLNTYPYVPFW